MSVEIKSGWVNALESVPSDYEEIKNNPNIMYLVHTAPIYCGRPDIDEDRYITSYWNANNDTWSNIYDGDIVLQWMPFKKVEGFNA